MDDPKALNIARIIMIMTLFSLATTTTTAASTPAPASAPAPASVPVPAPAPAPYPVCTSHHTPAIILGQDQNAMKAFTYVILVTNAKKLEKGMYNPLLHARLIDCDCARIADKRSPKDMAAALEKFCQRKKFVSVFEAYVLFLINLIGESHGSKRDGAKQSSITPLLLALDYLNI